MRDFLRGPLLLEGPDTSRGLNIKKEYPATRQRTRKRTMNETRRRTSLIPFQFKSQVSVVPWTRRTGIDTVKVFSSVRRK